MLYIPYVNQPWLITGRPALISRAKGNPMSDNARYIEGSTRGCRTALPRSPRSIRCFYPVSEIRPKSDRFCEGEFFNYSASTTYNFTALECTDFLSEPCPFPVDHPGVRAEAYGDRLPGTVACYSCFLGEKVRMRGKLVCFLVSPPWKLICNYCIKANETERFQISFDFDHAIPTTDNDASSSRSIFQESISEGRAPSSPARFQK